MSFARILDTLIRNLLAPGAIANLSASVGPALGSVAPEALVLDVGCGFLSPLIFANLGTIGVDINPERARAHAGPAAVAADATALPFADGGFAVVASMGLLHHLEDTQARQAIAEMVRVASPGGVIAIFDGVRPVSWPQRPFAALIRSLDFGRHMRNEAGLRVLFTNRAAWRFERMTYARTGLEGVWCVRRKEFGPADEPSSNPGAAQPRASA